MGRTRKTYHRDTHRDGISLDQRASGNWRARVWDQVLRKYRIITRPTEAEARAAAEALRAKFTLGADNAADCKLDAVWEAYRSERMEGGKAKPRTIEAMQRIVDGLRAAGAVDFKATRFRAAVARFFKVPGLSRSKAEDGRAAVSTRKRMLSQVRALVNFARQAGWMPTDPLAGFQAAGSREQDDTTREVLTIPEARRLVNLDRWDDPVWVHACLCLYAGMRDAEAQAVTWNDYETSHRLLWVQRGKGNKRRAVSVQPELAAILERVSAAIGPTAAVPCLPSCPIARPTKGRCLARFANFVGLLAHAGIPRERGRDAITAMPRRLHRHSLRHTYCAAMLATGEPGDNLRIMMGHTSSDLTRLYGGQVATFKAGVEAEGWERGRLCFRAPAAGGAQAWTAG